MKRAKAGGANRPAKGTGGKTKKKDAAAGTGSRSAQRRPAAVGAVRAAARAAKRPKDPVDRKALAAYYAARLAEAYSDARCSLDFESPLDLYVATVLSAQCTDARVNQVTPALFRDCRRPEDYVALGREGLERRIQSTGFFRNKAKSILGACEVLIRRFGAEVPSTMEDLVTLPGVGRKTANVILGTYFGKQEGIVVDTHVARLAGRLGLTSQTDPVKIEQDLMPLFPREEWTVLAHRLILHGRSVCLARSPRCDACVLAERCPSAATLGTGRPDPPRAARRSARR